MSLDVALGRWLAYTIHPYAAWRRTRLRGRIVLIGSYFSAGYLGALVWLSTH